MNRKKEIQKICRKYDIKNYTINDDYSIDVDGTISFSFLSITELPLKIRNITGNFYCSYNNLTSLEGAPSKVGGSFYCDNNSLTSLEGAPSEVGNSFDCSWNKLTSLNGIPLNLYKYKLTLPEQFTYGDYNEYCIRFDRDLKFKKIIKMTTEEIHRICKKYNIMNYAINEDLSIDVDGFVDLCGQELVELPLKFRYVSGDFECSLNLLKSLEGSPKRVDGHFNCSRNKISNFKGAPKHVGEGFYSTNNILESLEGIPLNLSLDQFHIPYKYTYSDYLSYCKVSKRDLKFKKILKIS